MDPFKLQQRYETSYTEDYDFEKNNDSLQFMMGHLCETAVNVLTDRQLRTFYLRYALRLPEYEIAKLCGISQPRVSAALKSAINRLKLQLSLKKSNYEE
jgi:DNA-directed RNA polymerase specialized sigma subunit